MEQMVHHRHSVEIPDEDHVGIGGDQPLNVADRIEEADPIAPAHNPLTTDLKPSLAMRLGGAEGVDSDPPLFFRGKK